ncbi:MAG: hypothetical protein ABIK86_08445 [candidate division WOR-3 bacterium]
MQRILSTIVSAVAVAAACNITFTPARDTAAVGDTLTFKVLVTNIHIPCLLKIDASKFSFVNSHLVSSDSTWKKLGPTKFQKSFSVVLDSIGTAKVTVRRKCDIKESTGTATILVRPAKRKPESE